MEITVTEYKRCDVVQPKGRLDSNTVPDLQEKLKGIMDQGKYKIVLDMTDVTFVSSRGWWLLIDTQKQCKPHHGEVIIVNLNQDIQDSLNLVGMGDYFKLFDDLTAAVGSF